MQIKPRAANEAGHFAILGRMADQSGRFVNNQQVVVFVDDVEQFFHFRRLSSGQAGVSFPPVKEKWHRWLPVVFVALFAVSRIPGLLPWNFSAAYAFAFCAGVYFPRRLAWWLPLGTLLATDICLNVFYYHAPVFDWYMGIKTLAFAGIVLLGRFFLPGMNFLKLVGGGLLGAVLFYIVTNTASWLNDAAYAKTLAGWIQALTTGVPNIHPSTWEFFRNALLSGGLFTALFVAAAKLTAPAESPADKTAGARDEEPEAEEKPGEAKA